MSTQVVSSQLFYFSTQQHIKHLKLLYSSSFLLFFSFLLYTASRGYSSLSNSFFTLLCTLSCFSYFFSFVFFLVLLLLLSFFRLSFSCASLVLELDRSYKTKMVSEQLRSQIGSKQLFVWHIRLFLADRAIILQ